MNEIRIDQDRPILEFLMLLLHQDLLGSIHFWIFDVIGINLNDIISNLIGKSLFRKSGSIGIAWDVGFELYGREK